MNKEFKDKTLGNRSFLSEWVKRYAITSFVLLTFGFSYLIGGTFQIWINQSGLKLSHLASLYLPRFLMVIGPSVAAITVSYLTNGRTGVQNLLQKLVPKKQEAGWYVILPIMASAITFISFLLGGLSIDRLFNILSDSWGLLVLHLVIQTLVIGIGEELGWRGWLLPALTNRFSLPVSIMLIFIIWVSWHFPILFMGAEVVIPWLFVAISATIILT
ncbi:MAG: CPBP family intramembrane glutamic endopeptidase, partial [Marinoscillum sp.]